MKTLFICNLRPEKAGAFERVLAAVGCEHRRHGDRFTLVLAAEPIPEVTDWFRKAGIEWRVISEWNDGEGSYRLSVNGYMEENIGREPNVGGALRAATGPNGRQAGTIAAAERASHIKEGATATTTPERVRPWAFILPALRLLRQERPDVAVVHFGNELPSLVLSLLAPLFGIRGVKWVWQQDQQMSLPGRFSRWVSRIRLLALRFNHFVVVYEGGREAMVARGIPQSRISVVHNGVMDPEPARNRASIKRIFTEAHEDHEGENSCACGVNTLGLNTKNIHAGAAPSPQPPLRSSVQTLFPSSADAVMPESEHPLLLMSVGSMIPRKRQAVLVAMLAELVSELKEPDLRLVLIGDGPERARLEEQARSLGVQDHVVFLGKRNDVARLLCGADVFVHAAVAEGCAYALSEAMAAGVPLVVTEAGAASEQVDEGVNGYVVGVDDLALFKERVKALVEDGALREKMGTASRERWAAGFRLEDQAQAYWGIYRGHRGKDFTTDFH
jgi:glycosyltransferase involved in cell wall biosynthesis